MKFVTLLFLLYFGYNGFGQSEALKLDWVDLVISEFTEEYNELYKVQVALPVYTDLQKSFNNKKIKISGTLAPVDPSQNYYTLIQENAKASNSCGTPSPDKIIGLTNFKLQKSEINKYSQKKITIEGIFIVNLSNDIYELPYTIDKPILVE